MSDVFFEVYLAQLILSFIQSLTVGIPCCQVDCAVAIGFIK